MKSSITGLIAAPHTAFHADGSLNLAAIPLQARLLARNRVSAAFVCGTTGESPSLTVAERKQVVEAWLAARPAGLAVIVHVGHGSAAEATDLARHAQAHGADATAALCPAFFKPGSTTELVAWCAQVAAGAPQLPFYYYYIPVMNGVGFPVHDFLAAVGDRIPNLAGVKYTNENLMDFARCAEFAGGKYDLLFGRDEILLAGLALGARGAVGSTYNFAAPLFLAIIEAVKRGDLAAARRDQLRAMEFIDVLGRHGGINAGKSAMKFVGVDCGPVRLPLRALTAEQEAKLRADLEAVGFFTYCSKLS
jgi:N-acetylneuraminate lyase